MITILIVLLVIALGLAPAVLLGGWVTMLCLGALAHIFGVAALAVGYWPSCLVAIIILLLFGS